MLYFSTRCGYNKVEQIVNIKVLQPQYRQQTTAKCGFMRTKSQKLNLEKG